MLPLKVLVPVKRVIDYTVKVRIKSDLSGVETDHVKMSLNPFDEIALEEALRLKEKSLVSEIIAVSIGTEAVKESLRVALARGADRAILVHTEAPQDTKSKDLESNNELYNSALNIALILQAIVTKESPQLIIMGKQAIDDDANQTGQMLAGLLNWPQGTFASKVTILPEANKIKVTREVDHGLQTQILTLPAVITTDLRLNEPRYISLPNVIKAKSKPLQIINVSELSLSLKPHLTVLKVLAPMQKRKGIRLENAKALVDKLFQDNVI